MSRTWSSTYTLSDIEIVMRRFAADISMIAQSSGAVTRAKALEYAHDIELLAKEGYIKCVDVTLLEGGREIRAAKFEVIDSDGNLAMPRPGGLLWPRVNNPFLRIVLHHTNDYDITARGKIRHKLIIPWVDTNADTRHVTMTRKEGRSYVSNGWGLQRTDYS